MKYNLASARQYAAQGQLETWVHAYLNDGGWANPGLSAGLKLQPRYWLGPLEIELAQLVRTCGPEPEMPYRVDLSAWENRVGHIANHLDHPDDLPPLIVEYRQGTLYVCDGNHRYGALKRLGVNRCWVLIWYNSEVDWLKRRRDLD